jgi:capsular polysaccharide biosynthesis protein
MFVSIPLSGFLIGVILCSLAVLALELLDNTIKGQEDLEKTLTQPSGVGGNTRFYCGRQF